jgi:hypothetical protein
MSPKAHVMWAMMPPFCLWETAAILRGKLGISTRRWSGKSTVRKEGLQYPVYYYTPGQIARAWGNEFRLESVEALSVFTPPATSKDFSEKHPGLYSVLRKLDDSLAPSWPFKYWGDFTLTSLVRE